MRRLSILAIVLLVVAVLLQGCRRTESTEIKGSDTMVNLGQAWAERYTERHPDARIAVTGGGSGTGIAALINGTADIVQASREMKDAEYEKARQNGHDPREFVVARDGLSIIVHPDNPLTRLTVDQIADIYTGRITNWQELGGHDRQIVVLSRDRSSGTHVFFLEDVVQQGDRSVQFAKSVLMLPSSQAIADEVAGNPAAIGYIGMAYVDEQTHKALPVTESANGEYIEPTEENVLNGSYPIARPLYFYTSNEPEGEVRDFINFVLSDEGQQVVEEQEFIPIRSR